VSPHVSQSIPINTDERRTSTQKSFFSIDVTETFSARATGGRTASSLIAGFDDLTIDLFLPQCLRPVIFRGFNRHVGRSNVRDNHDNHRDDQGDGQRSIMHLCKLLELPIEATVGETSGDDIFPSTKMGT
jgi:hypothetical protein